MYNSDILYAILTVDKDMEEAYFLGHQFLKELDYINYAKFHEFLANTIVRYKMSNLKEFRKVGETFENWRHEIENSYLLIDNGKRVTNVKIEGRNNKIKTLKKYVMD